MNIYCVELLIIWSELPTSFCTGELSLLLLDNSDYSWISSLQDTGSNIIKILILSTSYTLQCVSFDSSASSFNIYVDVSVISQINKVNWTKTLKRIFQIYSYISVVTWKLVSFVFTMRIFALEKGISIRRQFNRRDFLTDGRHRF